MSVKVIKQEMSDNKIRGVLKNEITWLIMILSLFFSLIAAYFDIRTQLALVKQDLTMIRTNELPHITENLKEIKARNDLQDQRTIDMGLKLEQTMTILDQYTNKK